MRLVFKLFLLFLAATLLHWACMSLVGGAGMSLNIMLVFSLAVCAYVRPEYGYPLAFICGLFLDFFGVKLFGNNALIFTLCAAAIYGMEKRLDFDAVLPQMICVAGLSLAAVLGNMLLLKVFASVVVWGGWWPFISGWGLNILLAPVIFGTVRRLIGKDSAAR